MSRLLMGVALVALLALTGYWDAQEAERARAEYCAMVEVYKATNGKSGWPAYKGGSECITR